MQLPFLASRTPHRALSLMVAVLTVLLAPALASADTRHTARVQAEGERPPVSSSWHGRAIRDAHRHTSEQATRTGSSGAASAIHRGTGYSAPDGSRRVRAIQRRLLRLGYRPGPADGRFGPRTEAALRWFERKHGLESGSRVADATLRHLRWRASGAPERPASGPAVAPPERVRAAAPRPSSPEQAPPRADDAFIRGVLTTLVAIGFGFFAAAFVQGRRRAHATRHAAPRALPPAQRALPPAVRTPTRPEPQRRSPIPPREEHSP